MAAYESEKPVKWVLKKTPSANFIFALGRAAEALDSAYKNLLDAQAVTPLPNAVADLIKSVEEQVLGLRQLHQDVYRQVKENVQVVEKTEQGGRHEARDYGV